jgi:hypothetical protein
MAALQRLLMSLTHAHDTAIRPHRGSLAERRFRLEQYAGAGVEWPELISTIRSDVGGLPISILAADPGDLSNVKATVLLPFLQPNDRMIIESDRSIDDSDARLLILDKGVPNHRRFLHSAQPEVLMLFGRDCLSAREALRRYGDRTAFIVADWGLANAVQFISDVSLSKVPMLWSRKGTTLSPERPSIEEIESLREWLENDVARFRVLRGALARFVFLATPDPLSQMQLITEHACAAGWPEWATAALPHIVYGSINGRTHILTRDLLVQCAPSADVNVQRTYCEGRLILATVTDAAANHLFNIAVSCDQTLDGAPNGSRLGRWYHALLHHALSAISSSGSRAFKNCVRKVKQRVYDACASASGSIARSPQKDSRHRFASARNGRSREAGRAGR